MKCLPVGFLEDAVCGLGHTNGWHRWFQPLTKARILALRYLTKPKVAVGGWRSMIPNHTSTRFNRERDVGVKCTFDARVRCEPSRTSTPLLGGVVVHHQVQLAVGVGAGDLPEEGQIAPDAGALACTRR